MIHAIIIAAVFVLLIQLPAFAADGQNNNSDWNVLQLLLVIIPTVGAFITTKFVAQTWQDRKTKYELQQEILKKVDEAYTDYFYDVWDLTYRIGVTYFDESTYIHDEKNDKIRFDPIKDFPEDPLELPPKKFTKQYEEIFIKDYSKNVENLWTIILCYYGDNSTLTILQDKIKRLDHRYMVEFFKFFHSTDSEIFQKFFYKLYDTSTDGIAATRELKLALLNTTMKTRKL